MTAKPKSKIYEIAAKQSKLIDELIGLLKDAHEKLELLGTQLREQREQRGEEL